MSTRSRSESVCTGAAQEMIRKIVYLNCLLKKMVYVGDLGAFR